MHRIFSMLLSGACAAAVSSFVFAVVLALFMRARLSRRRKTRRAQKKDALSVSFLHPECLSGGGGERVLWIALVAVRNALPHAEIAVCAPWPAAQPAAETLAATRKRVSAQFHIDVPVFHPVRVSAAALTDAARYPRFTLVLQALGAAALGLEAYAACEADVFIDTANQAFSLVPAKLLGAVTMTYIHYPTISADMLAVVRARKPQFNNAGEIARSRALSHAKLLYYRAFAALYSAAGRAADVRMVNSSWTRAHIGSIWSHVPSAELTTVFPPCDTSLLSSLAIEGSKRTRGLIISVGQFRPEKNHRLQLEIMHKLVHSPAYAGSWRIAGAPKPKLIMIGSARHAADVGRVRALCEERSRLGLEGFVEVRANASWDELIELLSAARVGLHTMRDEHFGISIVELQAAGVVPVAHRSGGVALDIIEDGVSGFLAGDADEYALRLHQLLTGADGVDVARIRNVARERTPRFSDDVFVAKFGASCTRAAGLAVG
jgi:alpha-1,2-mannosyltransferase